MRRFVRSIREGSAPAIHTTSAFAIAAMVLAAGGAASCAAEPMPPVPCPKVETAPASTGAMKAELPADPAATVDEAGISTSCASTTPLGLALAPDLPWED